MIVEKIYDVHWEGAFKWEDKNQLNNDSYVLYSLHGTHHLYGKNVLLYIGMTDVTPKSRFSGHESWVIDEYDAMTIKVASIGEFTNWEDWHKYEYDRYPKLKNVNIVESVEALLIFAHQPAYNQSNKEKAKKANGIRIFNTGKLGQLFPEVSYIYHVGDK